MAFVSGFSHLAKSSKVHPCCGVSEAPTPFYGWVITLLLLLNITTIHILLSLCAMNICGQGFAWTYVFSSLETHLGVDMLTLYLTFEELPMLWFYILIYTFNNFILHVCVCVCMHFISPLPTSRIYLYTHIHRNITTIKISEHFPRNMMQSLEKAWSYISSCHSYSHCPSEFFTGQGTIIQRCLYHWRT